jgi:hypothetical protein
MLTEGFNTAAIPVIVYFQSSLASSLSINTTSVGAYSIKFSLRGVTVKKNNFSLLMLGV